MEKTVYTEPAIVEEVSNPEPGVLYEKKIIVDEPIRHESVRSGVKETFRHPIEAFKGQPRDRSPNEIRRKEYIEREMVPRDVRKEYIEAPKEVKKEYRTSGESKGVSSLGNEKPRSAKEIRSEFRKEPINREYVVREPVREEYVVREPVREWTKEPDYVEKSPVLIETREKGAVIKEHIHPKEREEIQPVIHREREKTEYVEVTKPIHEKNVMPTQFEEKTLPAETRPTVYQGESEQFKQNYKLATERYKPSVEVAPTEREVVEKTPIIKEHITRKVIEEIQPVIYREVTEPHIILETRPIYEKVVEGPTLVEKGEMLPEEYQTREYPKDRLRDSRDSREYVKEYPKEYSREYSKEQPRDNRDHREYIAQKPKQSSREYIRETPKEDLKEREDQPSEDYYKREPEIREYYNDQGKLVREYSYREPQGEYAKPLRTSKRHEIPITESREFESRG